MPMIRPVNWPARIALPHEPPPWIRPEDAVFFITICCAPRGTNQLCHVDISPALFESVRFRQQHLDWWMQLVLLMPDHLHALAVFPQDRKMAKVIEDWKHFAAAKLGIGWQRDFFDHRLRSEESWQEKADYILQNPVRAGLVSRAEDWPYVWRPG